MNEEEKETVEELRKQLRLAINIDDVTTTIRNDDAETILNLIEKLQKENEELKNQEATARRINELLVLRYSNSIPVQKVKDNIEKLKAQYKTALEKNSTEAFILKCQITILQEILKEGEE